VLPRPEAHQETNVSDQPKSFHVSRAIHDYLLDHGGRPDAIGSALIEETRALGGISLMQIAPEQGAFMALLARAIGAKRAIEVGTFTGFSALCLARALPEDGQLICCDVSDEWTRVGRPFWEKAGVADRIDLRIAPGIETLRGIRDDDGFDFGFIDADKPNYRAYAEELIRLIRPGGLILVDNVLWQGTVVDPAAEGENVEAIRAFNDWAAQDERVEGVMLAISDGLTVLRVR
jgi:caffeoyl-CoA O-methyltransferase